MRYLYLLTGIATLAASIHVAGLFTRALEPHQARAAVTLQSIPGEIRAGERATASTADASAGVFRQLSPDSTQSVVAGDAEVAGERHVPLHPDHTGDQTREAASSVLLHPSPLHDTMITPGNFQYLGAFRPPEITTGRSSFAYGGWGIAWRPDGDPDGTQDGFPGSLFLAGHRHDQLVAEISIPAPARHSGHRRWLNELPTATMLQPFADVTDGIRDEYTGASSEPFQLGGLVVTGGRLHWTMHKYYNVENLDYPSHGATGLNLTGSLAGGPWHLGPMNSPLPEWNSYKHAGYAFDVPQAEADRWFGGRNVISGLQISTGLQASSQGPAMFAYRLPSDETPAGSELDAVALCWYPQERPLAGHHPADRWTGGAWLTLGEKQAVVIAGRKSLGSYYYGEARPFDCTPDKGYHGTPYEFQLLFYSPASLIHAAHRSLNPTQIEPWLRWNGQHPGGGPGQYLFDTCNKHTGGLAYDRDHNLLYLSQIDAGSLQECPEEPLPVIHVFRLMEPEPSVSTTVAE